MRDVVRKESECLHCMSGDGQCSECGGTGEWEDAEICADCDGTGECCACDGTGILVEYVEGDA